MNCLLNCLPQGCSTTEAGNSTNTELRLRLEYSPFHSKGMADFEINVKEQSGCCSIVGLRACECGLSMQQLTLNPNGLQVHK